MTRRLIEQWIPSAGIGVEGLRERATFTALPPPFALHVWWARRPLIASRAAIAASLLPAWPTNAEAHVDEVAGRVLQQLQEHFPGGESQYQAWFVRLIGILGDPIAGRAAIVAAKVTSTKLAGNGYGYPRAFTVKPAEQDVERFLDLVATLSGAVAPPVVLDSFAGGGSIPFESVRLGCDTIANELNPVASAILQGTVVLPSRLGGDFVAALEKYGTRWSDRVRSRMSSYFPREGSESIAGYIWAHTVPCPTTGLATPLVPDFWLARSGGREVAVALRPDTDLGRIDVSVIDGPDAKEWGNRSTYKRGVGESLWTGETFSGDYIREMAASGRVGSLLLAVSTTRSDSTGRSFRAPTQGDLDAVAAATAKASEMRPTWEVNDLLPTEPVPSGWKTDEPRRMSINQWSDMFSPRQLLTNVTALEELRETVVEARDALGEDLGNAIGLYLALALDKAVDYNGMLSSWDASRIKVRNTFDRHDFAYKWTYAESDGANALVPWVVKQVVRVYRGMSGLISTPDSLTGSRVTAAARVIRGSAAALPLGDSTVDAVVTDPPYYDNVMYAEISDYFYVWLKRSLRATWPEFTDLVLTDKTDEAVANPSLFRDVARPATKGRRNAADGPSAAELADARYEELLTASFSEAHRVLKENGVLTVMFTHKRIDAWDTLGAALLDAGFSITASWPVHTESEHSLHQARKNSAASTIFLACRKRRDSQPGYWADIRRELETAAEEAAHRFASQGMTGVDLTIATYGPVLSVLSDRWPVFTGDLGADGQPEVVRPDAALDLAREKVANLKKRGLLGGRDVDFDRVTDWWLLAWSDFQAAEFPFDEGRKLSIAMHLEFDEVANTHKVVKASAGSVTLLTPAQRATAGAIGADETTFATWLDRLHTLMLVYEEDGLGAARSWLNRTGLRDDPKFRDLVEAALNAVPRVRTKGALVCPEAKTLDSLRASLFEDIALPTEPEAVPAAVQLGLLDEAEGDG